MERDRSSAFCFCLALMLFSAACQAEHGNKHYIAIIIDDLGHNRAQGHRALDLPAPITYAMLPYAQYSRELAERAQALGKEVMLHLPMANVSGKRLGPGALVPDLSRQEFIETLEAALAEVPYARGLNNHMGSLLTSQNLEMDWLMTEIKRREMFFVDSRTTPHTVALATASDHAIFSSSRDVFLDNEQTLEAIDAAFELLVANAKRNRTAIAIGHPYEVTLDYLEAVLPTLAERDIVVVPVSHGIALERILARQSATDVPPQLVATD